MTRNPNIQFNKKKKFAHKIQALEIKVGSQIEDLFIRFQIKKIRPQYLHPWFSSLF
jgi:hypothetical protein